MASDNVPIEGDLARRLADLGQQEFVVRGEGNRQYHALAHSFYGYASVLLYYGIETARTIALLPSMTRRSGSSIIVVP